MLCARCKGQVDGHLLELRPQARWAALHNPLSSLLCARCGTVLPSLDAADAMLSKLSQLSKFGLGADDRPILTSFVGGK